jgi:poly(3-hydroxyalkanoate) synthetase
MKTDEIEAMKRAIAAYAGPVTRCAPGKARAKPLKRKKVRDDATRWLRQHRHDVSVWQPFVDENVEAERGRRRKARSERKRVRRAANTAARKRIRES